MIATCSGCGSGQGGNVPAETPRAERAGFALVVNGEPVKMDALTDALAEAAGARVVRELALDRAIASELARRGLSVDAAAVEREQRLFAETVGAEGPVAAERIAARRGLGPVRFASFLRRNAGLRMLVGEVSADDADVEAEAQLAFGPAVRARLVVSATERDAATARARAIRDDGGPSAGMAAAAMAASIDPSAAVGGVFERTQPSDPRWPTSVARALATQPVGEIGPVIGFEGGAAVVLVEERFAGRTPSDSELSGAVAEARQVRQARAMATLARRLAASADVTVLDPSLAWSVASFGGLGPSE